MRLVGSYIPKALREESLNMARVNSHNGLYPCVQP